MGFAGVTITRAPPSRRDAPSPRIAAEPAGVHGHGVPGGRHVLVHGRLPAARPDVVVTTAAAAAVLVQLATIGVLVGGTGAGAGRRLQQGPETVRRNPHVCARRQHGRAVFSRRIGRHHRRRGRLPAQLVSHMRQNVRATEHAQDALAHALRRETVPVRRLQQVVQPGGQPDGARAHALRRKTVPVPNLRPAVLAVVVRHHPHAHALGRTAVPVPAVQESVQRLVHAHQTPAHTLGRKTVPVQAVPAPVLAVRQPEQAHARAQRHERR